ncbi:MAG: hypothetical protein LC676_18465 [Loktanella sp.]|nr:hypothetical protein [Loktanella sp.]
MKIALHIGANCTDDERLLKSLLNNANGFGQHDIKVPGPSRYRRIIRETIQNLKGAPPAPDTRGILLDAILDDQSPERLIMSHPAFICIPNRIFDNGIFYEQTEFKLKGLVGLFPDDEIELFLGIRNPATWLPLVYAESKASTFEAYLKGFHPTYIRWSDVIRRIRYVAPKAKLTVWCNEDTPFIWAELIRAHADLGPYDKITGGFDLLATIMSEDGMNRFLNYLQAHPPQNISQKYRVISAFLDRYALDDQVEEDIALPELAPMADELTAIYEADVDLIAQMDDVTFIST